MMVANVVLSSLVNGYGCRLVVVFSGCSLGCEGCFSEEIQAFDYGKNVNWKHLADIIAKRVKKDELIDGLTISGGNPQEQPDLTKFLKEIKRIIPDLNIWAWSGFTMKEITSKPNLLEQLDYIDVIITGRYEIANKCDHPYYGSSNQNVWRKKDGEWKKD